MNDVNTTSIVLGYFKDDTWVNIDAAFTVTSIVAMLLTLYFSYKNWKFNKRQSDVISLYINNIKVDSHILRQNFNRAEIKGILSELHDSDKFFRIKYIADDKSTFLKDIYDIQVGTEKKFIIKLDEKDFFIFHSQENKSNIHARITNKI